MIQVVALFLLASPRQDSPVDVWNRLCAKLANAKSVKATIIVNPNKSKSEFTMVLAKPKSFLVESKDQGFASDGTASWLWINGNKKFYEADVVGDQNVPVVSFGFQGFFQNPVKPYEPYEVSKTTFEGTECQKLLLRIPGNKRLHWIIYIDSNDLPLAWEQRPSDLPDALIEARYQNVQLDQDISSVNFAWKPPTGFVQAKFGAEAPTLKVGSIAPPVNGKTVDSKPIEWNSFLKKNKIVLLNFWFVGCTPCREEFPALDMLYRDRKSKGLGMVAIDNGDSQEKVAKFLRDRKYSIPALLGGEKGGPVEKYQVSGFPTTYLIDSNGKIVDVIVGENMARLEKALKDAGID